MIKAWLWTIAILVLFAIAYLTDLFEFLSNNFTKYFAVGLLIFMLGVAGFVLGNPFNKDRHDDKSEK